MEVPTQDLINHIVNLLDEELREEYEERAGIIEYEAKVPRAHA